MDNFYQDFPYHRPILKRYRVTASGEIPCTHGAHKTGDTVKYELLLPRAVSPECVTMYVWTHKGGDAISFPMTYERLSLDMNVFTVTHEMAELASGFGAATGLFYFGFDFISSSERVRVIESDNDGLPELCRDDRADGAFQLTVYERKYAPPVDWYGGIIYHIFVDRFKSSGRCSPKPYAVMNGDWYGGKVQFADYPGAPVANDMFFGGDLYGVAEKLDYIKSLGVTCIYLSPVFDAHSNHKYDTGDFETVDSMFGGDKALRELINKASECGISVILDGVFNHTGSDSKYFNKDGTYEAVGAYQSENSEYYNWFNFFSYPDDYECWWGVKILPRVDSANEKYIDYITGDGGVAEKYMQMGLSGWRLDVVDELSDEFVDRLAEQVHESGKKSPRTPILIGEVWEDASCKIAYGNRRRYFHGSQLDSVMNYPVRSALIEYITSGDAGILTLALHTVWDHYPDEIVHVLMNLLSTHDTARIITTLAGDPPDGFTNAELSEKRMDDDQYARGVRFVKLAYMINATIPGIPSIYYGDEVGMQGYTDPFNRLPFPWGRENEELLEFFRIVGDVRRGYEVYENGELRLCRLEKSGVFMFGRELDGVILYTVVNRSGSDAELVIDGELEIVCKCGDVSLKGKTVMIGSDSGVIVKADTSADVWCE